MTKRGGVGVGEERKDSLTCVSSADFDVDEILFVEVFGDRVETVDSDTVFTSGGQSRNGQGRQADVVLHEEVLAVGTLHSVPHQVSAPVIVRNAPLENDAGEIRLVRNVSANIHLRSLQSYMTEESSWECYLGGAGEVAQDILSDSWSAFLKYPSLQGHLAAAATWESLFSGQALHLLSVLKSLL